jgi:hypothetical protein
MADVIPKERALWLDRQEPGCRCQRISISERSPGAVADAETLIRIAIEPDHFFRNTGLLRPTILLDAENRGMSVFREEQAADAEIRAAAERIVANARTFARNRRRNENNIGVGGLLRIKCCDIRAFCGQGETDPCYCVYDNASRNSPAHAAAFQRIANVSAEIRDARRNALFERIKDDLRTVDQFRGGLLKDLAPGNRA